MNANTGFIVNNTLNSNRGEQVPPVAAAVQQVTHRNTWCANHGPTLRSKNIYLLIFCSKEYKTYPYTCGEETQGFRKYYVFNLQMKRRWVVSHDLYYDFS